MEESSYYKFIFVIFLSFLLFGCLNQENYSYISEEIENTTNISKIFENTKNTQENISMKDSGIDYEKKYKKGIEKITLIVLKENGLKNKNIIFSPYNIYEVSSLLYYASSSNTKEQFENFFGFDEGVKEYISKVSPYFKTANGIWVSKDIGIKQNYKELAENYYSAIIEGVDFSKNPEKVRSSINRFIESKTNGNIKDLFPVGSINKQTKVVIAGSIYFKDKWKKEFSKNEIRGYRFYSTTKEKIVDMLTKKSTFSYYENGYFQAIKIPYENKSYMLIVLPKKAQEGYREKETLGYLEENGLNFINKLKERRVDLMFPKFEFSYSLDLKNVFMENGFDQIFKSYPDFSNGFERSFIISSAFHKAKITVDEKGTEASASTGFAGITSIDEEYVKFYANHPFFFFIMDEGNSIMFAGKVEEP